MTEMMWGVWFTNYVTIHIKHVNMDTWQNAHRYWWTYCWYREQNSGYLQVPLWELLAPPKKSCSPFQEFTQRLAWLIRSWLLALCWWNILGKWIYFKMYTLFRFHQPTHQSKNNHLIWAGHSGVTLRLRQTAEFTFFLCLLGLCSKPTIKCAGNEVMLKSVHFNFYCLIKFCWLPFRFSIRSHPTINQGNSYFYLRSFTRVAIVRVKYQKEVFLPKIRCCLHHWEFMKFF